jgi:GDP-L-fucose synthase
LQSDLTIAANVINSSYKHGVKKLLNLGSSCIYPKLAPQPMKEDYLLSGQLEPTNEPYAVAKIAAIKLCRYYNEQYGTNFLSVMPTNLYGPNDNFNLQNSHVLPALIRKFHEAKITGARTVSIWGTGKPYREFLYVDDLAEVCVMLMECFDSKDIGEFINIGTGEDLQIRDLAAMVKDIVGFKGEIIQDLSKQDGTSKKLLDVSRIKSLGWSPRIVLPEGIKMTYEWYLSTCGSR